MRAISRLMRAASDVASTATDTWALFEAERADPAGRQQVKGLIGTELADVRGARVGLLVVERVALRGDRRRSSDRV